jgi:very-short-patch-repair endonuclease
VTGLARTLVDFAEQASTAELERALNEARVLHHISDTALARAIRRAGRHHGAAKLAALLRQERGPGITRKEMERIFLGLIRRARLPLPETNADVLGRERDFYWPEHRLVVETDGWETHSTRAAFEDDRRRDAELTAAGYRVLRFTWRQITEEPEATIAILATALVALR